MESVLEMIRSWPILLLLLGPLISFFLLLLRIRRKRFPPGPRGWPIIGNMGMVDQLTHHGLAKLAKTYGGIFHIRMGFAHTIVISSPDIARLVLLVQDNIFANRPTNIGTRYLSYERADMAFANYGPFWRQMRKLCVMNLFSRRRVESWESVRDEVDTLVRSVAASTGSPVDLGEQVFELTRGITYRAAFGTRSKQGQDQFIGIMQEFSQLFGVFNITDFLPNPGWADHLWLSDRLLNARKSLDGFIDEIIDDHMERRVSGNTSADADTDMVDELLTFYGDEVNAAESDDLKNSIKLTKENIKALIMDVMFGGTETVASAIEWAMAELLRCPEELKRVQQELATVVGLHRRLEESDLENLTFFKCTIKEVLRLHPPIPLLVHESSNDTMLAGYHIPAKSRVVINAYVIGRDPTSWSDPESFKPSRFLEEGVADFKGSDFQFIPFGSGRRSCPGMQLGLYASEIAVANLLHCFTWELPDGMKPNELDMNDSFGLTSPKATRLVAVPNPRLVCPIY